MSFFGGLAEGQLEKKLKAEREKHQQASTLADLLDRPDVTIDAKDAISKQLGELLGGSHKDTVPVLARIFHLHQKQKHPSNQVIPQHLFGNPDERLPTTPASSDFGYQPSPNPEGANLLNEIGTPPSLENQRRGSMTSGELDDQRKLGLFGQEQSIRARFDAENDRRTRDRQVEVKRISTEAAAANLHQRFTQSQQLLTQREQLRARRDISSRVESGMTPEAAAQDVFNKFQQEGEQRGARIQLTKAMVNALPERLKMEAERVAQGWANVGINELRSQIYSDLASSSANLANFDRESKWAFESLNDLDGDLRELETRPDLTDPTSKSYQPEYGQKLAELRAQKQDLLKEIYRLKGQYVKPSGESVPNRTPPARGASRGGSKYVAPKVSTQRLQELMQ